MDCYHDHQQSSNQTFPKIDGTPGAIIINLRVRCYLSTIYGIIDSVVRDADQIVAKKQKALDITNNKEKYLLAETEQIKLEIEKIKILHSVNLSFHKEYIEQLLEGMQSLTSYHDDLLQQLKMFTWRKT